MLLLHSVWCLPPTTARFSESLPLRAMSQDDVSEDFGEDEYVRAAAALRDAVSNAVAVMRRHRSSAAVPLTNGRAVLTSACTHALQSLSAAVPVGGDDAATAAPVAVTVHRADGRTEAVDVAVEDLVTSLAAKLRVALQQLR